MEIAEVEVDKDPFSLLIICVEAIDYELLRNAIRLNDDVGDFHGAFNYI